MSNHDQIRAALERLVNAEDNDPWSFFDHRDALAAARAALAASPAVDGPAVPPVEGEGEWA